MLRRLAAEDVAYRSVVDEHQLGFYLTCRAVDGFTEDFEIGMKRYCALGGWPADRVFKVSGVISIEY